MKSGIRRRSPRRAPPARLADLRRRLAESEATLRAIRAGEVDAVVVASDAGPRVFTLEGADHPYRVLIESMNEGALTLAADAQIQYANECFARMVGRPLEQVIGSSLHRFLGAADQAALGAELKRTTASGAKLQVHLRSPGGPEVAAQISIRRVSRPTEGRATIGLVVTDMTGPRRGEQMLRALTRRVVEVQEAERARLALELHDHITQSLCAVLFRSQALADRLSGHDGPATQEARGLREALAEAVDDVERISRNLRPGVLEQLGLVVVLRSAGRDFADKTGVAVKVACANLTTRLPADVELALFRVLQASLRNVRQHARARRVRVALTRTAAYVQMSVADDGVGFEPGDHASEDEGERGLGLLSMVERAAYVGGTLTVRSAPGRGTTIRARVPVAAARRRNGPSPG